MVRRFKSDTAVAKSKRPFDASKLSCGPAECLYASFVIPGVRTAVPGVIDSEKERTRLERDLKKLEKELGAVEKKLANPSFLDRAPEAVVEKSKRDASQLREKRERLEAALRSLGGEDR